MNQHYSITKNNTTPVDPGEIPVLEYGVFFDQVTELMKDDAKHCIAYYCFPAGDNLNFHCCLADDNNKNVLVLSHSLSNEKPALKSLTPVCPQFHIFEREIYEKYGVNFEGHPWLKPVRYPHDRADKSTSMDDYPFYQIDSEELHEVGVGPVHAGVIEPGHFRFICNGEKVLHLEIQLGYQHRGIEKLITDKRNQLQRCIASESIAGDTSVGHALAHVQIVESLGDIEVTGTLRAERCIALELERIAVHIGDTAALCGDVAYQLGQVVCEALRTTIINTTQLWCGNRFGKGLVRPGGSNFPLFEDIADEILKTLADSGKRFAEITERIYSLSTVLARYEDIGIVTRQQALSIGAVGMAARSCGIMRDTRRTHPFQYYKEYHVEPVIQNKGDVLARGMLRALEVKESIRIVTDLVNYWKQSHTQVNKPIYELKLKPERMAISMVEGWRGEIVHTAFTGKNGDIAFYRIADPSLHNWMALALAVRNQEISDFPLCNKSFNLSYCGNDL